MERWIFYRKSRSTLNMLQPLFIRPQFFIDLIDNDELFIQTKNFIIKFDDIWEEIFILVDDDNESLKKEYENIIKKYSQEFPPIKTIVEKFLSLLQYKNVKIKTNKKGFNVNNILQTLKENDVRHVVEFPNYFENPFINLKKIGAEIYLIDIDHDTALDKICSISRFGKKIILNDAMIPYNVTNLNNIKNIDSISNNPNDFKYSQKATFDILVNSLNKIIYNIYKTNFFKDELEICICTTINPGKINHIKKSLKDNIQIEAWNDLGNYISKSIKNSIQKLPSEIKIKVLIKDHYLRKVNYDDPKKDVYQRSIFSFDLDTCLQVRKGLDIFEEKSKNKLRNESSYYLKMMITESEKRTSMQILSHADYKAEKIH